MEKLSLILWRERELLDTLQFKLEVEQMVLAGGRSRWLYRAARDVDAVLAMIRETELLRAIAADEAGNALGLGPDPSLAGLADAAEEPWRSILTEHRDALLAVTREITELAHSNRDLLAAGYRSTRETLRTLGELAEGYHPTGDLLVDAAPHHRLVDRSL